MIYKVFVEQAGKPVYYCAKTGFPACSTNIVVVTDYEFNLLDFSYYTGAGKTGFPACFTKNYS